MAVKFGKAMGLEVTVISTSEGKRKTAMDLGATHFISSKDEKAMQVFPWSVMIVKGASATLEVTVKLALSSQPPDVLFEWAPLS